MNDKINTPTPFYVHNHKTTYQHNMHWFLIKDGRRWQH